MLRVTFLTQFFYPDIQATSQVFLQLCEDLAKEFRVSVVCGYPLILDPQRAKEPVAGREIYGGIEIIRANSFRQKKKSLFDRFLNHASFTLSSFLSILLAAKKTDVFVFTSDNPLNFINALLFLGKPKIYICEDIYLEQGLSIGYFRKGFVSRFLGLAQRISFALTDKIVVINEQMKVFLEQKGLSRGKISVIPNWADTEQIRPSSADNIFSRSYGLQNRFVLLYSGRLGLTQDFSLLLGCASILKANPDIQFAVIGEGVRKEEVLREAKERGLPNILFLPFQPRQALNDVYASAGASLILEKKGVCRFLAPSKLYNIMASARPVIACIDKESEVYDIINNSGCGIALAAGDLAGLKEAILSLYLDRNKARFLGEKGREWAVSNFSRTAMTEKYCSLIRSIKS